MVKDPVCGMEVDPKSTKYSMEYKGTSYYFCSDYCLNSFKSNPEKYLDKREDTLGHHGHHGHGGGCCGGMAMGSRTSYILLGIIVILVIIGLLL